MRQKGTMAKEQILHIGFDDTDSPKSMCTTFLAFKIVDYLRKQDIKFLDYPGLIRFNPNIPWKTRGNGAVSLKIKTNNPQKIKNQIKKLVTEYSDTANGANPGLAFYDDLIIPKPIRDFSEKALWSLIHRQSAKKLAQKYNLETFHLGNGQGLVGAIGAIGYAFQDWTVELLSYRKPSMFGKKRKISSESVKKMQDATFPKTFNSFDYKKQKILIAPHGPDPVFFGLRGENEKILFSASKQIKYNEKLAGHLLFRSNQGTDDHLKNHIDVKELAPYTSGTVRGFVSKKPEMNFGGYVSFLINCNGIEVNCSVYRPTGLAKISLELIERDEIIIGGAVRKSSKKHPRTINVEFIEILNLKPITILENPKCRKCNKKMKSKGKNQNFLCIRCGTKESQKIQKTIPRRIKKQRYVADVSAHRHLTRPEHRIKNYNKIRFDESLPWFSVYKN